MNTDNFKQALNAMSSRVNWTRQQHVVALYLYNKLPFGLFHQRNPEVVKYSKLLGRTPSALAMKLSNFASLDPVITSSGRKGLKGASKADVQIWEEMNSNWGSFSQEILKTVTSIKNNKLSPDNDQNHNLELKAADQDRAYFGKERTITTRARVGQSLFRSAVLSSYNFKCCMSGLSIPRLLIASHIVPWKDDPENRLHPANGLALSMIHDKAFDSGIITVTDDYKILVSKKYHSIDDEFFNSSLLKYNGEKLILPNKFSPKSQFLEFHRDTVFESLDA